MTNYPDRFVFNTDTDEQGLEYKNAYSNQEIPCIVSINGKNLECRGHLKLFTKKGEKSSYGEELGIVFQVREVIDEYDPDTDHETVEFYLDKDIGLNFLEKTLKHFKNKNGGD